MKQKVFNHESINESMNVKLTLKINKSHSDKNYN